ncbi:MAG: hypothetical protein JSW39_06950 [Desulfobacterales bacterium]|nr:MAG: hypothetical protein JSW39_06950 [Desulfobacterales bacterium]
MAVISIDIDQDTGAVLEVRYNGDPIDSDNNIHVGDRQKIAENKAWLDQASRRISVPLDLYDFGGKKICSIVIGGVLYKCPH